MLKGKTIKENINRILTQFNEYFATYAEREKYKDLIDEMSEAVIIEDKNYNIIYVNPAFAKLIGLPQKDCVGRSVFDFINEKNKKYYTEEVNRGMRGETPEHQIEISYNGKVITALIGATQIYNDCHVVTISDLTKLENFQRKFQSESEKYFHLVQTAYKEMGSLKRKLDYLNDLINFTTVSVPIAEVHGFIVSSIMSFTKADACVLRRYRSWGKKFFIEYAAGVNNDWYNKKPVDYKGSLIEKTLKSGGILQIEDIQKENLYLGHELAEKNGFVSMIYASIGFKTKLLGYVSIYFKRKEDMQKVDFDFLNVFLKQAAIAIEMNSK